MKNDHTSVSFTKKTVRSENRPHPACYYHRPTFRISCVADESGTAFGTCDKLPKPRESPGAGESRHVSLQPVVGRAGYGKNLSKSKFPLLNSTSFTHSIVPLSSQKRSMNCFVNWFVTLLFSTRKVSLCSFARYPIGSMMSV